VFLISNEERIVAQITMPQNANGSFAASTVQYLHPDALGSIDVASTPGGQTEEHSFDAWGNPRNPQDWKQPLASPAASKLHVGFTGHESDSFGLVTWAVRCTTRRSASSPRPIRWCPRPGSRKASIDTVTSGTTR
jgi:hypothetical protein